MRMKTVPPYLAATSRELNALAADIGAEGGLSCEVEVRAGEFRICIGSDRRRAKVYMFPTSAEVRAFLTGLRAANEGGR